MYHIHSNLLFWCRLLELQSAPLFTVEPHRRSRSVWDCTVLWNCRSFDIYIVFSSVILHLFSLCFSVEECTYTLLQLKCHRPPRNPFVFVVAFAHAVALLLLCCAATVHCKCFTGIQFFFPCVFQWKNVHIHCCNSNVTGRHETHSYSLSLLLTLWLCYCCAVQQQCTVNVLQGFNVVHRETLLFLWGILLVVTRKHCNPLQRIKNIPMGNNHGDRRSYNCSELLLLA